MTITVSFRGEKELIRALNKITRDAQKELAKAVDSTGLELRGNIIKLYNRGPATGIVYQKYLPSRIHQASAPSEAPATDTGRLANSVVFSSDLLRLSATVSSELAIAAYLEFGTMDIAKRPAWVPAAADIADKFQRRVENAIRRSMP